MPQGGVSAKTGQTTIGFSGVNVDQLQRIVETTAAGCRGVGRQLAEVVCGASYKCQDNAKRIDLFGFRWHHNGRFADQTSEFHFGYSNTDVGTGI